MAEYWKSTPKYWCKHCSTFVKDTPLEKKQHEETGRHQGQLKRFLRGIQNDHEKAEREKQKARAEVDRLNKAVGGISSTLTTPAPAFKKSSAPSKVQASAADRKKQIQQLVDMGIAVPDEYRADMALAGDWKVMSTSKIEQPVIDESLNKGVRKRKVEGQEEEEEEAGGTVVRRGWGSATKQYPGEPSGDLDALLSMNPLKKGTEADTTKTEDDPHSKIDTSTAILAATTEPNPGPINENCIKSEDAGEIPKINLIASSSESPAPIFKKRKQKKPTV